MGGTELKRKVRRNRMTAVAEVKDIKRLKMRPVIKNIDVEAIKKEFEAKKQAQA